MKSNWYSIGGGVYEERARGKATGKYRARITLNKRRTWRVLAGAKNRHAARKASANGAWCESADNFAALARLYQDAGCPNRKFETRTKEFIKGENARLVKIVEWFGRYDPDEIRLPLLPKYAAWRMRGARGSGGGTRAVDKDFNTLSNVLQYGIAIEQVEQNHIRSNRPRYRKADDINRSRNRMPKNADEIHQMSEHLLDNVRSEVFAWMNYFAMFTGCRTSELLRLRMDAREIGDDKYEPGCITHADEAELSPLYAGTLKLLHLKRSKHGINPWALIGPEFDEMLDCFHRWHKTRYPRSKWYFPGLMANTLVDAGSHGKAIARAAQMLNLPKITPHGFRAYYVTKRRRDKIPDPMVAAEIGDKTVALISNTYGETPGKGPLGWKPSNGLPSWQRWRSAATKVARIA